MNHITAEKLVYLSETAIASEIEAVREKPSTDVLVNGKKVKPAPSNELLYRFETGNRSLRFAEQCKATLANETVTISPVDTGEEAITFRFPKDFGEWIDEVELEWENDFVLKCIGESLCNVLDSVDHRNRIKRMVYPSNIESVNDCFEIKDDSVKQAHSKEDSEKDGGDSNKIYIKEDGLRNAAQRKAIEKAMCQPVSYIWGPPGTGKTATLAYVMANYVIRGKSVLFVSNTNRAVDNGMLGLMDAMERLQMKAISRRITRFGERVLDSKRLDLVHFEQQLEALMQAQMQEAADLKHWLDARDLPELTSEQKRHIAKKIERLGGEEAMEEQIGDLMQKDHHAFTHLRRFRVVGTTLARVCTSDMLNQMEFDAVVIDEASMASIPYMLVMASKAKEHMVIVGDPMQLPPIAITSDPESKKLLEQDIFAIVSGAKSTGELFQWHDQNPAFTSFFNIQYRMQSDLARVISEVFYEGRLVSAGDISPVSGSHPEAGSIALVDSSPLGPVLRQNTKGKGFQPVNDVHVTLLNDMVRQLLITSRTGLQEIGIIVPFRSSVWHLRRELRGKNRWYDLEIGTIHTFQGREKKVIILDTVMSGEVRSNMVQHYSVRPFDEAKNGLSVPRLLNVAFSRSKEYLLVLADMEHIRRVYGRKFLGKLLGRLPIRSL